MNPYNSSLANMLRTLAEYIEMSESPVKLRIGIQFKLPKRPVVNLPVLPADKFAKSFGSWVSQELVGVITKYRQVTGNTDGDEMLANLQQAVEFFKGVDKPR